MTRTTTPGLETALAAWVLSDRRGQGESVKATLKRKDLRFDVTYALGDKRAKLDAGKGRSHVLLLTGEPGDPAAWSCDCPIGQSNHDRLCLHAALAARGLSDAVADGPTEEAAPDPSFAVPLELSPGLASAVARSSLGVEPLEDGTLRVGEALVSKTESGALTCDCPLGHTPSCLHRAIAAAWARGERTRTRGADAVAAVATQAPAAVSEVVKRPGEALPAQDRERFLPILEKVERLIAEVISFGLSRTTAATLERLDGLIVAAQTIGIRDGAPRNAGLGRLRRRLESLREVLAQFQQRLVTTTELHVMHELAHARNLVRALRANTGVLPLFDFAGATQQEYEPVAALDLQGLGLEAWTTDTGYVGVTAYVADLRTGRVLTRGNSRPVEQGASIDTLASEAAFGGSTVNYAELARGRYLVSGAELAPDSGRLSGSKKTQLAKRPPLPLDDPKLRGNLLLGAGDAARLVLRLGFDPLGRPPASPPVAIIPTDALSTPLFDRATQRLTFDVATSSGAVLPCLVHYRDDRALWVDNLEKLAKAKVAPKALFARFLLDPSGFRIEPLTAYYEKGAPQHLTHRPLEVIS